MTHIFIVNPQSGNKQSKTLVENINAVCCEYGVNYEIYFSEDRANVFKYAEKIISPDKDEKYRFYACGGDGTLSGVAEVVYRFHNAELGFIPFGTGNDFARTFGSLEQFRDLRAQIKGHSIDIDLMMVNGRVSTNVINIGFDCAVASAVEKLRDKPFMNNSFGYTIGVIGMLVKRPTSHMRIICDEGEPEERDFLLTAIGNGCYYGGGYKSCCEAKPNDGMLDFVSVPVVSRLRFVSLVGSYKKGTYLGTKFAKKRVTYKKVKSVSLHSDIPVEVCIDGDVEHMTDVNIKILPAALKFILPASLDCPWVQKDKVRK